MVSENNGCSMTEFTFTYKVLHFPDKNFIEIYRIFVVVIFLLFFFSKQQVLILIVAFFIF